MKITKLTESINNKVFFKVAVGEKGQAKLYSKLLTKELINKISTSLKEIRVYINIQANKENDFKSLRYEWLNINEIKENDDIQKELFLYASKVFREYKDSTKDNINVTIHTNELSKELQSLIQWDIKKNEINENQI